MRKISFAAIGLALFSTSVFADQFSQVNVEIDRLGSHAGQVFFMTFKEGFKTDCAWSNLYCPASNADCKNYFSLVLAAKLANKKLFEVRYTQDNASRACSVDLVQIN